MIIDNLFQENLSGIISNGAQKFTRNQMNILSSKYETVYLTAKGSDRQYKNQIILENKFELNLPTKSEKIKHTKLVASEISSMLSNEKFDLILDSSGKHMSSIWKYYPSGSVIFEHYHMPSMPLSANIINKFENNNVYWVGVSKNQSRAFNDYFHDTINIHLVTEFPDKIHEPENYGIMMTRWDKMKGPHIAIQKYIDSGSNMPLKVFMKYGGSEIDPKYMERFNDNPLISFHIDQPREIIFDSLKKAKFCLGVTKEASGIVSIEAASHGVPYVVCRKNVKDIAELEHMPEGTMFICHDEIGLKKIISEIDSYDRKEISQKILLTYGEERFIKEHERIFHDSMNKYKDGGLLDFL